MRICMCIGMCTYEYSVVTAGYYLEERAAPYGKIIRLTAGG
jgi:hypothetical protein